MPYTIIGILAAIISWPQSIRLVTKPIALIINVKSLWWYKWLPKKKGVRATTIGHVALMGPKLEKNDLEHELIHVEQSSRLPIIFPFLYYWESIRKGYMNNKFEIEAYQKAGNVYLEK